jgi:hypothetical protein
MRREQAPIQRTQPGGMMHDAESRWRITVPVQRGRARRLAVVAVLSHACAPLSGEENQTLVREEQGEIASAFYDVRLDDVGASAGCPPPWPEAILSLGIERETWAWAASSVLLNAPGTPAHGSGASLVEVRVVTSMRFVQSLWTPLPWDAAWELDTSAIERHLEGPSASGDARTILVSDPRLQLLLPLVQDRYAGILLSGGVSVPSGSDNDWFTTHRSVGAVVSLRASWVVPGIPLLSAAAGVEIRAVPHARQSLYTATPATMVTTDYDGVSGSGVVAYRWSRCWAAGALLRGDGERFSTIRGPGIGAPVTEELHAYVPGAFVRMMMPARWFWHIDATRLAVGPPSWGRCALGGGVSVVLW